MPLENLVILPTYNEKENLPLIVREILSSIDTDILIIDDNSPDGTGQLAQDLTKESSRIFVMHRQGKLGLGTAYLAGFSWALARDYQKIFQMDSDFSHQPKYLQDFLKALNSVDFVLGSRYVPGGKVENWPVYRLWISSLGSLYARLVLGMPVKDFTGGFKGFNRRVLEFLIAQKILATGYGFQIETTYRSLKQGFKVQEIPITFVERVRGQSKISKKIMFEAFFLVWKLRRVVK